MSNGRNDDAVQLAPPLPIEAPAHHPLSHARGTAKPPTEPALDLAPSTSPWVRGSVPAFGGSVQLHSASGGLESVWIKVLDDDGDAVKYHPPVARYVPAAVRLTPSDARALAAALLAYADSHPDTDVG